MGHIGVGLFDFGGSKFLVCVDQWSGYPAQLYDYFEYFADALRMVQCTWLATFYKVWWRASVSGWILIILWEE